MYELARKHSRDDNRNIVNQDGPRAYAANELFRRNEGKNIMMTSNQDRNQSPV